MVPRRTRQLLSRLLRSLEPPSPPRRYFSRARQGPRTESIGAPAARAPRPDPRTSVMCCIEDASAASRSALEFAARMARRRHATGGADLVVVLVCPSPLYFLVDPVVEFGWPGPRAGVEAIVEEVSAYFGPTTRVYEVGGWSQEDIATIAREQGSDTVILSMLEGDAGRLMRWTRRYLVSGLIARTHAVVVDEYDRPFAGNSGTSSPFSPA
jgi:hypothetical protein